MSDTQPAPTPTPQPTPSNQPDTWANRFTLVVSAVGYGVVLGAIVVFLFQTGDTQIGLLIIGALLGILSQKESWFTRGRVENPSNQARTGTGDGGTVVTDSGPTVIHPPPEATRTPTSGGGGPLRPPEPPRT